VKYTRLKHGRSVITTILTAAALFPVGATANTIVGTPFNLNDIAPNGTDSSATFVVAGYLVSGGTDTPATVTFTASSTGKSLEQLLNDQENGTADVITYGAQLQTVVGPEPSTKNSLMLGAGSRTETAPGIFMPYPFMY
jgi:hypothetical protein